MTEEAGTPEEEEEEEGEVTERARAEEGEEGERAEEEGRGGGGAEAEGCEAPALTRCCAVATIFSHLVRTFSLSWCRYLAMTFENSDTCCSLARETAVWST